MADSNITPENRPCSIDGCNTKKHGKLYCQKHYRRWKIHGDPMRVDRIVGDYDARFEQYVERIPFSDCEYWVGVTNKTTGYGQFSWGGKAGSVIGAHRARWMIANGPIPDGLHVLHTCHQGHHGCVALHHLKLGTNADNMRDRESQGNTARGERSGVCKYPDAFARAIQEDYAANNLTYAELGRRHGITRHTSWMLVSKRRAG